MSANAAQPTANSHADPTALELMERCMEVVTVLYKTDPIVSRLLKAALGERPSKARAEGLLWVIDYVSNYGGQHALGEPGFLLEGLPVAPTVEALPINHVIGWYIWGGFVDSSILEAAARTNATASALVQMYRTRYLTGSRETVGSVGVSR